jgi:hypothetical protein
LSAKALIVLLAGTIALSSVLAAPQASPLARLSHDADIAELLGNSH